MKKKVKEQSKGILPKYFVERLDDSLGKHDECRYFVLDPKHDKFARKALGVYAIHCFREYPKLAEELINWIDELEKDDETTS